MANQWQDSKRPGNADFEPPGKKQLRQLEENEPPRRNQTGSELEGHDLGRKTGFEDKDAGSFENVVGRGYRGSGKIQGGWLSSISGRKKALYGFGIGGGIAGIMIALFFSMTSLELIHIKNVFYKEVGGVQSRVYQLGRQKYYSRMFFFDKNADFSGYKDTSIRGRMYKNRQTQRLTQALERNGYKIEFEKVRGIETGRIKALHRIDRRGDIIPGQSITNEAELTRAWDIRKSRALPEILRTVYPDETARWHGRQAKKLYKRWGLTRTNWIADYLREKSGAAALERKELAFRAALRQKLFGVANTVKPNKAVIDDKDTNSQDRDVKDTANTTISNNELADTVAKNAKGLRDELLANPELIPEEPSLSSMAEGAVKNLSPEDIARSAAKSVPGSMVRSLSALGVVQNACIGKGALDSIVTGARVLRASQLMGFGMAVLNIADAMQDGKAVRSQDVALMMSYLNSKDKNGKTMFNSSGWRYWTSPAADKNSFSFSKFDKDERNKYSVGGGFTGTLASVNYTINQRVGAGSVCKKANNIFVQIGSFAVGIGAGILTGGAFTATNLAANMLMSTVVNVAVSAATEMLTPIVAGTVVHGGETGTAVGNALVSGFEVLSNANGANAGMRPLTGGEFKTALADTKAYQQENLEKMSLAQRLFSPENDHSITMSAAMGIRELSPSKLVRAPLASLSNLFGGIFSAPVAAESVNNGCPDTDIRDEGLAATPFCTVIVGLPKSLIDDPNYYPDVVEQRMVEGGYIDQDGNPIEGKGYDKYLAQCTSNDEGTTGSDYRSIDIIHDSSNLPTNICYKSPLFNMYRFYSYIGETEYDGLTGEEIGDSASSAPLPTAPSSEPVTGDAKEIASKILEAGRSGKITFNVLNAADTFDSSTPEANIAKASQGAPANTSTRCSSSSRPPAPSVILDINLLKFIYELSQVQSVEINSLAGQCHSSSASNHYRGTAVDFDCPFNTEPADRIGRKYGVSRNYESCSENAHFHYSVGGN